MGFVVVFLVVVQASLVSVLAMSDEYLDFQSKVNQHNE